MHDALKFSPEALRQVIEAMAAQPEQAQTQPAPPGTLSPLSLAMLLGGNGADAASTIYALRHDGVKEANPVYGSHPSAAKVMAIKGLGTAAQWAVLKMLAKQHPKLANGIAKGIGIGTGAVAANNIRQVK